MRVQAHMKRKTASFIVFAIIRNLRTNLPTPIFLIHIILGFAYLSCVHGAPTYRVYRKNNDDSEHI